MATISRVVGSGFTTLNINGKTIGLLEGFQDSGQRPLSGPEPVYSIGHGYANEVVTSRVLTPGTLTCRIREVWHQAVWKQVLQVAGASGAQAAGMNNIIDAYKAVDALPDLYAQMIIKNPNKNGGYRGKVYHDLTITEMDDGESVSVADLAVPRTITFMYVKATHFVGDPGAAVRR